MLRPAPAYGAYHTRVPLLQVPAFHEKPKAEGCLPEKGGNQDGGEDPVCEARSQNQREAVRQIAQPGDLHQNAYRFWQIARSEDQDTENEAHTAEEYQGNAEAIAMRFDRQARHRVKLLRLERFEVFRFAQREQCPQQIELNRGFDG